LDDRHAFGRAAEDQAAAYLLSIGFTMVTRRFKTHHGEIDLVCLEDDLLVFVEVKARRSPNFLPEESIGEAKRTALISAVSEYFVKVGERRDYRFDVVAIHPGGIRHHRNVFGHGLTG
jgi:putative endonuclease